MNFATIIDIIDMLIIAATVLFVFIIPPIKGYPKGEAFTTQNLKEFFLGYAYGYSQSVYKGFVSNGKLRIGRTLFQIAFTIGVYLIGLELYAAAQVIIIALAAPLSLFPEPKLSAMEKIMLDLDISLKVH